MSAPSGPGPAGDGLLGFLLGRWRVDRRLTDRRAGLRGRFAGQAEFAAAAGAAGLTYREHGELSFGSYTGPAWRELCYRPAADGTADVQFADGRPFYRLDLRQGRWQARHDCGADIYLGVFEMQGDGLITEHWQVSGPAKDYDSRTELRRVSPPSWPWPPG